MLFPNEILLDEKVNHTGLPIAITAITKGVRWIDGYPRKGDKVKVEMNPCVIGDFRNATLLEDYSPKQGFILEVEDCPFETHAKLYIDKENDVYTIIYIKATDSE